MNYEGKRIIVILFNLAFVFGIILATNGSLKWIFVLTSFYLIGTLLGTFFGFYTCKIQDNANISAKIDKVKK